MSLPAEEIVIPAVIFGLISVQYTYAILSGTYGPTIGKSPRNAIVFFRMMRAGWVDQNHLTGQAAVNTTRDYIRVVVFLAGNAIICASILSGIALNNYGDNEEGYSVNDTLMMAKLGSCVALLIIIFLLLMMCMRYMLHFSFLINVKKINGKLVSKRMMEHLFEMAHRFHSIVWALLLVGIFYLLLVHKLEDISFMEKDIDDILDIEDSNDLTEGQCQIVSQVDNPMIC